MFLLGGRKQSSMQLNCFSLPYHFKLVFGHRTRSGVNRLALTIGQCCFAVQTL